MNSLKRNILSYYVIAIFIIGYAIYQAFHWKWICDDAYISFLYARNLWEGNGLVFNVGERVEGYTNFLWTIFLSIGYGFGIQPQILSVYSGIFFFLAMLLLFFKEENDKSFGLFYPLLVIHLSLFYHFYIFASSGLETSVFTFFISLGLLLWEKRSNHVFLAFLLASLIRPEGALFLSFVCLDWFSRRQYFKPILYGFLFFCFIGFRYHYYSEFFPNTFYAKGNKGSYLSQGLYYFLYLIKSYPLYPFVIFLSGIQLYHLLYLQKDSRFMVSALFLYIIYVFYVGGDFMGNRFWIPVLPFFSYLAFQRLQYWTNQSQIESNKKKYFYRMYAKNSILFSFVFILSSAIYSDPLKIKENRIADWHGIVEERMFYDKHLLDSSGYDEDALKALRVAFFGAQAHFIYYLKPNYAFEAESGLTDKIYSKKQILERGRIGHETQLSYEDLNIREIDLLLDNRLPELDLPFIIYTWRKVPLRFYLWNYHPIKIKTLCKRKDWSCETLYSKFQTEKWEVDSPRFFGTKGSK
ncbi:hypothetical protein [Leptospira bouyouniensis]|uniref:hypothetical protein n=1 Tax=Leptospira bouyouniensis TaxID=2484911 RepID=UPI001090C49C|nr:hypothetical protein [Leptospira bouyouniensis]TGM74690.1 hypothetical protein EHQ99_18725 [Leptospira bouyouniensis]